MRAVFIVQFWVTNTADVARQKPCILSDESVNSKGFRVLTSGIGYANFAKNPVMFYCHNYSRLPIGRMEDLEIRGTQLVGVPNFDDNDEFAKQVESKYANGILNAASLGIDIVEISDDANLLLPGQRRATVTKCDIFEISIADIPSNKNAVKLNFSDGLTLSGDIPEVYLNHHLPILTPSDMKEISLRLGLPETATEAEILSAIDKQKLQLQGATDAGVKTLVAMAEKKGLPKETIERLAKANFDDTLALVTSAPEKDAEKQEGNQPETARLSDVLREFAKQGDTTPSTLTFSQLAKDKKALTALFAKDAAKLQKMYADEFKYTPTLEQLKEII